MQAWTRNSSVSSQALYHRALLFEELECNVVLLTQLCRIKLYKRFVCCMFFLFVCFFTANYVDSASFEPCHKIAAINVAFLHEKNATSIWLEHSK